MDTVRVSKNVCRDCDREFASVNGLRRHEPFCTGSNWACAWCGCNSTHRRMPGPRGIDTLCARCGVRYRRSNREKPEPNAKGLFQCSNCTKTFPHVTALYTHEARFCTGVNSEDDEERSESGESTGEALSTTTVGASSVALTATSATAPVTTHRSTVSFLSPSRTRSRSSRRKVQIPVGPNHQVEIPPHPIDTSPREIPSEESRFQGECVWSNEPGALTEDGVEFMRVMQTLSMWCDHHAQPRHAPVTLATYMEHLATHKGDVAAALCCLDTVPIPPHRAPGPPPKRHKRVRRYNP